MQGNLTGGVGPSDAPATGPPWARRSSSTVPGGPLVAPSDAPRGRVRDPTVCLGRRDHGARRRHDRRPKGVAQRLPCVVDSPWARRSRSLATSPTTTGGRLPAASTQRSGRAVAVARRGQGSWYAQGMTLVRVLHASPASSEGRRQAGERNRGGAHSIHHALPPLWQHGGWSGLVGVGEWQACRLAVWV